MKNEEFKKEIEAVFWLVQNKMISVDECFERVNDIRTSNGLSLMGRDEFDSKFVKNQQESK